MPLGDFAEDTTIDFKFTTMVDGVLTTLAGSPAVAVYPANSLTEITAGVTLTVDFDGRTGLHHVRLDTAASASYIAGADYDVILTAGTLGGVSMVGYLVEHFSIGRGMASDINAIVNAMSDSVVELEGSITLQQALSLILAAVAGVTTNGGLTFKSPNGVSTRIVGAASASNERTSVTLSPSG